MQTASYYSGKRVWVAGHSGLVGSSIVRRLSREPCEVLVVDRSQLDLLRQQDVERWVQRHRPDVIFLAAGKVGGILANSRAPADFLYENILINANIMAAAHAVGVQNLVVLGSSCIYPRDAAQPICEEALLTGLPEPTNEGYAIAKIAALKLAEAYAVQYGRDYIALMPTNLYGPNDNFDLMSSHVLPALIRKFADAVQSGSSEVTVWGSGAPLREFLHADDLADACVYLAERCNGPDVINVGSGEEIAIGDLARLIAEIAGFQGNIVFDRSKPDGAPRKRLDTERLKALGWQPRIKLRDGLRELYRIWVETQQVDRWRHADPRRPEFTAAVLHEECHPAE